MLVPKLVTTLKSYSRQQFFADLVAGVIVGVVALPLAIAFAIASGVTPQSGLYTAIIAGFVISALGGSRVQIGGPTGAFVVIVYGIVQRYGVEGLTVATLMAGVILIGLGLARLGGAIKFIPYPVTTGFTAGIGVVIFSSQVKDFLGLRMAAVPAEFVQKWRSYAGHLDAVNLWAVGIGVGSILIIQLWPRINRRIPGPFVALVVATAAVQLLHLDVETIGARFGAISGGLPAPRIPQVTWETARELVQPAFTIERTEGEVVGIDISDAQTAHARRRLARSRCRTLRFLEYDIMRLADLDEEPFDAAVCLDAACYLPEKRAALRAIATRLTFGARLLVVDWCRAERVTPLQEELMLEPFYRRWAIPEMETMCAYRAAFPAAGFRLLEVEDLSARVRPNWERAYHLAHRALTEPPTRAQLVVLARMAARHGAEGVQLMKDQFAAVLLAKAAADAGVIRYAYFLAERLLSDETPSGER